MSGGGQAVPNRTRIRRKDIVTAYILAVVFIFVARQHLMPVPAPANEPVTDSLVFISDFDPVDASRRSNSVFRISLDGSGLKRIAGSIPYGFAYLRSSDIDCHRATQQLVIASGQPDLNGFHHALLDGSGLHLDRPAAGAALTGTRQIAIAPDGAGIIVSRQFPGFAEARFGLVAGDLMSRHFAAIKPPSAKRSYLAPDWSPGGGHIAYIIARYAADGSRTLPSRHRRSGRRPRSRHPRDGPANQRPRLVAHGRVAGAGHESAGLSYAGSWRRPQQADIPSRWRQFAALVAGRADDQLRHALDLCRAESALCHER